jgi:hypothetical protein
MTVIRDAREAAMSTTEDRSADASGDGRSCLVNGYQVIVSGGAPGEH